MNKLYAKIMFKGSLDILTGLHIGGSDDFAAIGAIDNSVIKDSITNLPIIPGSSLKGKLRYLLSRIKSETYVLNKIDDEDITIKRLFGSGNSNNQIVSSRLQFFDLKLNEENANMLKNADTDLYVTEAKFENTIDRITAVANPRQVERVPAGAKFDFKLVYNVESIDEFEEDIKNLKDSFDMLEMDYLGGNGTRGYGRVKINIENEDIMFATKENEEKIKSIIDNVF